MHVKSATAGLALGLALGWFGAGLATEDAPPPTELVDTPPPERESAAAPLPPSVGPPSIPGASAPPEGQTAAAPPPVQPPEPTAGAPEASAEFKDLPLLAKEWEGKEAYLKTLRARAHRNGLPLRAQASVDTLLPRSVMGAFLLGGNFEGLRQEHDLSRALLERLQRDPYPGVGYDLGDLPEHHATAVVVDLERLAFDTRKPLEVRREAVNALGRLSLPRIVREGRLVGRLESAATPDPDWPPKDAEVIPSRLLFGPQLRTLKDDPHTPPELRALAGEWLELL